MRLSELQNDDKKAMKLRSRGLSEGWEDIEKMFYYKNLLYVLKIIHSELISRHHNNLLIGHFSIEKTCKLIANKYYCPILQWDVEAYVKDCNIGLSSKTVWYKLYGDL